MTYHGKSKEELIARELGERLALATINVLWCGFGLGGMFAFLVMGQLQLFVLFLLLVCASGVVAAYQFSQFFKTIESKP